MIRVVGVRFKKAGKVYYFDPAEYPIAVGARVVVETARGVEYGEVAVGPKDVTEDQVVQPLKKVLRIGTEKDALAAAENKRKENEAFGSAMKKIEAHNLEMNLVDVEYTFDGSKIIFYFTAEGRIDFRELVRDLASVFRTRIEMRQIGVRDEAKLLGGIGPCGRILCCTSFLGDFAPVSIRMAKDQNLSLNPSKISGLCGRLMCCLRYEQETYEAAKKDPTLSPGYVPPVLLEEPTPGLADLEDRPTPAIGVRPHKESGMSARIAQAAGLTERPKREERRGGAERPVGDRPPAPERPPQGRREQPAARPQGTGQGRPQQGQTPGQAQGGGERPRQQQGQPRPQQQQPQGSGRREQEGRQGQQPGGERQGGERQTRGQQGQQQGQPRPQQQQSGRLKGQPQGGERQGGERPNRGQQAQNQRPPQPGQQERRPQGEARPATEGGEDKDQQQQRSRNHRNRRRGGGGGGGGGNAEGATNSQGGGNPQA